MPKKPYPIERYDGGMDNNTNASDLEENELVLAQNVDVSNVGIIRMLGEFIDSGITGNPATVEPGYGLFAFKTDRTYAGAEGGAEWIASVDTVNGDIDLYEIGTTTWRNSMINYASAVTGVDFNISDGIIRTCPIALDLEPRMLLYIDNNKFGATGYTDDGWVDRTSRLSSPIPGVINDDNFGGGAGEWVASATGFANLNVEQNGALTDAWPSTDIQFAFTCLYHNNQESGLTEPGSTLFFKNGIITGQDFLTMDTAFKYDMRMSVKCNSTGDVDEAIKAYKLYARVVGEEDWYLLAIYDIVRGAKSWDGVEYTAWTDAGVAAPNEVKECTVESVYLDKTSPTYLFETGYAKQDYTYGDLQWRYKTSVMAGRSFYIANVYGKDENGVNKFQPDAMYKSIPGKPDVIEQTSRVEVAINDGEDIVKLEYFGDRILQFKEQTLYIVNVSQSIEFLESRKKNMGIKFPYHSFETEYGIVWINENGLYFYNGQNVRNLLEKKGKRRISESFWSAFFGDEATIGYDPKSKKIIIRHDNDGGTDSLLIYHFVTDSFVTGNQKTEEYDSTNFIVSSENKLIYGYSKFVAGPETNYVYIEEWDDSASASDDMDIITKAYNIINAAIRKKIYRLYITHKGTGANDTRVSYRVNGDTTWAAIDTLDGNTNFVIQALTMSGVNNVYKIQFRIYTLVGLTDATFEINDMNIIFRNKTAK